MVNFEREFYTNPDQDLNALWWNLVERFQRLRRPDTAEDGHHWATKIHFVVAPVYYHNYQLGRMYAAQLRHRIGEAVPEVRTADGFNMQGQQAVGQYLIENVFRSGAIYPWTDFVRRSTGEELTARYFAEIIGSGDPPAPAAQTPAAE